MASQVPAAVRTLAVLKLLASATSSLPAAVISRNLDLPRSSTYHLLQAMEREGFVTYFPEGRTWGLGVSAFEVGSAYLRHEPLENLARPMLRSLVAGLRTPVVAHLGILQGRETLYLLKETPKSHMTLVTDVGVRLPAHLTASGRAIVSHLSDAQFRAIFPNTEALVDRTGKGPQTLSELRNVLTDERRRGFSFEDEFVTPGYVSVAMPVLDRVGHPTAAIACTTSKSTFNKDVETHIVGGIEKAVRDLTARLR